MLFFCDCFCFIFPHSIFLNVVVFFQLKRSGGKRLREEVICIDVEVDAPRHCFYAKIEERELPRDMKRILFWNDAGVAWPLGRLVWSFLDVQSRFRARLTDKNRSALPAVDAATPIRKLDIEFQAVKDTLTVTLTTCDIEDFTRLSPDHQTPARLFTCLTCQGLHLIGERFIPARNAAYVLQGPHSNKRYTRLFAHDTRKKLLGALRQSDGDADEGVTIVIVGPIPKAFVPSIHAKERDMQNQWGFFPDLCCDRDGKKDARRKRHHDALNAAVEANNKNCTFDNASWPLEFHSGFYGRVCELPIVIED